MGRHKKNQKLLIDDVVLSNENTDPSVEVVDDDFEPEYSYECTRSNLQYGSKTGEKFVFHKGDNPKGLNADDIDYLVSQGFFKIIN
jgi:hypothetical protein